MKKIIFYSLVCSLCPPSGGESAARRRHEHQDRRLWLQQWVHRGQQVGHFLRLASVRSAGTLPGEEVRRARSGCLEPGGDSVHAGQRLVALWRTEPEGGTSFWPKQILFPSANFLCFLLHLFWNHTFFLFFFFKSIMFLKKKSNFISVVVQKITVIMWHLKLSSWRYVQTWAASRHSQVSQVGDEPGPF